MSAWARQVAAVAVLASAILPLRAQNPGRAGRRQDLPHHQAASNSPHDFGGRVGRVADQHTARRRGCRQACRRRLHRRQRPPDSCRRRLRRVLSVGARRRPDRRRQREDGVQERRRPLQGQPELQLDLGRGAAVREFQTQAGPARHERHLGRREDLQPARRRRRHLEDARRDRVHHLSCRRRPGAAHGLRRAQPSACPASIRTPPPACSR